MVPSDSHHEQYTYESMDDKYGKLCQLACLKEEDMSYVRSCVSLAGMIYRCK